MRHNPGFHHDGDFYIWRMRLQRPDRTGRSLFRTLAQVFWAPPEGSITVMKCLTSVSRLEKLTMREAIKISSGNGYG